MHIPTEKLPVNSNIYNLLCALLPGMFFLANDTIVMLPRIFYMDTEQYRTLKCG